MLFRCFSLLFNAFQCFFNAFHCFLNTFQCFFNAFPCAPRAMWWPSGSTRNGGTEERRNELGTLWVTGVWSRPFSVTCVPGSMLFLCFFNAFPCAPRAACQPTSVRVPTGGAYFQCFSMLFQWLSMLFQCFSMLFSDHEVSRLGALRPRGFSTGSAQTNNFLDWERSDHEFSRLGALRP